MYYLYAVKSYEPQCEQEIIDCANMLQLFELFPDNILLRENKAAHLTSSAFIVNKSLDKVLFVYHNIYNSWSWAGGHADGNGDLLQVACREAREETGLPDVVPLSPQIAALDILPVTQHKKNGKFVSAHLHLNLCYFLAADDTQPLQSKPDENKAVAWLPLEHLALFSTEAHMLPIYQKLVQRLKDFPAAPKS